MADVCHNYSFLKNRIIAKNLLTPALLVPITIESEGEVFDNEYEYLTHECMDVVCVYVIARHCATLQRAHHIIQRDMHSHLKYIQLAPEMVYAEIYALKGFSISETLSMYHYHLQRALGAHVQVWVSTKGGQL